VSAACWGCHGDLIADRPGPERLPQFLFFTGIAASLLAALSVQLLEEVPPAYAYCGVLLLPLAIRVIGRGAAVQARVATCDAVAGTEARAADEDAEHGVFDKATRTKAARSTPEHNGG
jgi:hypothetical protein